MYYAAKIYKSQKVSMRLISGGRVIYYYFMYMHTHTSKHTHTHPNTHTHTHTHTHSHIQIYTHDTSTFTGIQKLTMQKTVHTFLLKLSIFCIFKLWKTEQILKIIMPRHSLVHTYKYPWLNKYIRDKQKSNLSPNWLTWQSISLKRQCNVHYTTNAIAFLSQKFFSLNLKSG